MSVNTINIEVKPSGSVVITPPTPPAIQITAASPPGVSKEYVDSRTPKITPGTTAPTNPAINDVWIDTN